MISCDFAPNEQADDAVVSTKILLQPWTWYTDTAKKKVNELLSQYFCSSKTTFFLTGRSALFHLIANLGIQNNSFIAVTGFTCSAVVLPILQNNCSPLYIDIEKKTLSMSFSDLKKKWNSQIKLIILQHTFGMTPKNRQAILQFALEQDIPVLEDLAHGFDPQTFTNHCFKDNQYGLLSFGRSKWISSVFGAAILSKKEIRLRDTLQPVPVFMLVKMLLFKPLSYIIQKTYDIYIGKLLLWLAKSTSLLIPELSKQEKNGVWDSQYDFAYPDALAQLLLNQLAKQDKIDLQKKKTMEVYSSYPFFPVPLKASRYPLLRRDKNLIIKKARSQNIFLGTWYSQPVAPQGLTLHSVRYNPGSCPVAESTCTQILNVPLGLPLPQIKKITSILSHSKNEP